MSLTKLRRFFGRVGDRLRYLPLAQRRIIGVVVILLIAALLWGAIVGVLLLMRGENEDTARFALTSTAFSNNEALPPKYSCDEGNLNPPFEFVSPPKNTKSFAILMEDTTNKKDRPIHWMTWNIPAESLSVTEGIRPPGTVARSYIGNFRYDGPCPPPGETHTYVFHLYALEIESLTVNATASRKDFDDAIKGKVVAEAKLTTSYKRVEK
jgi:Raf kinase inhibitor-like YbhB/YbcL family protein